MIHFDTSQAPLFHVTVRGDIDRDQVRAFYREFKPALDTAGRPGLVVDLTGFDDITAGAMLEDVVEEFSLLDDLAKMPRTAVVTGNRTLAGLLRYLNPIIPRMELRSFTPDEITEAATWAADLPETAPHRPGLSMIDSGHPDVLAFELDGYMDDDDIEIITRPFRDRIDRGGKFNALARLKHFAGFDPEILFDRALLGMKSDAIRALHRYAIVTDQTWVRPFASLAHLVSHVEVKIFPLSEEQAAWDWVRQPVPQAL